jgi:hypothetical protein
MTVMMSASQNRQHDQKESFLFPEMGKQWKNGKWERRKRSITLIHLICPILISRDIYHIARYSIDYSSFEHIFKAYLISSHLRNTLLRPNKQPETRLASLPQDTNEDRTWFAFSLSQKHFDKPTATARTQI